MRRGKGGEEGKLVERVSKVSNRVSVETLFGNNSSPCLVIAKRIDIFILKKRLEGGGQLGHTLVSQLRALQRIGNQADQSKFLETLRKWKFFFGSISACDLLRRKGEETFPEK